MQETNDYTRAGAAVALLKLDLGDTKASAVVRDCLNRRSDPQLRIITVRLIRSMGPSARVFIPDLQYLLSNSDLTIAAYSRGVLKELGSNAKAQSP